MKTPAFWQSKNLVSTLLLPLATFYEIGATLRRALARPLALPLPVICVGNLTAGGAGKTPAALHIGERFREKNLRAFFLSRGYGGSLGGPLLVDLSVHTAEQVGDEPLLLARTLPTVVAKDRASGARFARAAGAEALIMDDGFQNPSLAKTLSFVVIDGEIGFGNGRLIPAGPLREDPASGFGRAQAAIIINRSADTPSIPARVPALFAQREMKGPGLHGKKVVAFCGIAYPEKFFGTLARAGAIISETASFADHHTYTPDELRVLLGKAALHQAILVTTAKDAVRLPKEFLNQVIIVDIALVFDNPGMLDALLTAALKIHGKR